MKQELLNTATYSQVAALHEVYANLVAIYEDICNGPRNCRGYAEYHAALFSQRQCENRLAQLTDEL